MNADIELLYADWTVRELKFMGEGLVFSECEHHRLDKQKAAIHRTRVVTNSAW